MTMSGTCATHVLTKAKLKAVWSRRLRCERVSRCWWSVNCCVQACKQTQRDTQRNETREMCSCWGYKQHKVLQRIYWKTYILPLRLRGAGRSETTLGDHGRDGSPSSRGAHEARPSVFRDPCCFFELQERVFRLRRVSVRLAGHDLRA